MNKIYLLFSVVLVLCSCNNTNSFIKKDLNSRYTDFEIVEIKPDSANIEDAMNRRNELKIMVANSNLEVVNRINEIDANKDAHQKSVEIDSIYKYTADRLEKFEKSESLHKQSCFYVKYRVGNGSEKETHEEYFTETANKETLHRPCDWNDFLKDMKYAEIVQDNLKYYSGYLQIRQ